MIPQFNSRPTKMDDQDVGYLFDLNEDKKVLRENIAKSQTKCFRKLKMLYNIRKLKQIEKRINNQLMFFYELVSYETKMYINELNINKNYLQFLIKLVEYFKQMKKDIYEWDSIDSVYNKYNQDTAINIELEIFLQYFLYNKSLEDLDIYSIYTKYLDRIYNRYTDDQEDI